MIYFKIKPVNKYTVNNKISFFIKLLIKLIKLITPKANPDFDNLIGTEAYWLIEFEEINNVASREIGLDENEKVIMKMPYKDNYGYWTDNNLKLEDFERLFKIEYISKEEFEKKWDELL